METSPLLPFVDKDVTVTLDKTASGLGIAISVDPEPIVLTVGEKYRINWSLVTGTGMTNWDFDQTAGVVVLNKKGKFHTPQGSAGNPKKYSWKNDADVEGDYKYTITLTDGTSVYTIDPTIRNQQ